MIREFTPADIDELKQLVTDEWYWDFFTDDHYKKFVSEENNTLTGVACISTTLGTTNIDFIYVKESARSQGIGTLLINQIQQHCKEHNSEGLTVNCGEENIGAQRFYEREGFEQVGKVFNYFSNNNYQLFYWKKP